MFHFILFICRFQPCLCPLHLTSQQNNTHQCVFVCQSFLKKLLVLKISSWASAICSYWFSQIFLIFFFASKLSICTISQPLKLHFYLNHGQVLLLQTYTFIAAHSTTYTNYLSSLSLYWRAPCIYSMYLSFKTKVCKLDSL